MSGGKTGVLYIFAGAVIMIISIFIILAGCNGNGENGPLPELSFDNLAVDFGMVEAEAGTTNQSITVTNSGDESVTVTDAVLSDTANYTLTTDTLPLTLEPGDTTTLGCDFHPQASGTIDAAVTVSAEELDEDVVISLTGEGNYAPVVGSGYYVSAWDSNFEGFYVEDGEKNGKPKYVKQHGTTIGYLFYYNSSASASVQSRAFQPPDPTDPAWVIADSLDITDVSSEAACYTHNNPPSDEPENGDWNYDSLPQKETGPVISSNSGGTVAVYYGYSDAEGDGESGTAFQWYRCDTADDAGTPIDGATEKTYTITDSDSYLRCGVLPKAGSGIAEGSELISEVYEVMQ